MCTGRRIAKVDAFMQTVPKADILHPVNNARDSIARAPTRTKLSRPPGLIETKRICLTDEVDDAFCRKLAYSPICLVPWAGGKVLYIVDGNHRFRGKVLRENAEFVSAWVLGDEDRNAIRGRPVPFLLDQWASGALSFGALCLRAREAGLRVLQK